MKRGLSRIDFPEHAEKNQFLVGVHRHEGYVETFKGGEDVIAEEIKKYLKDRLRKKLPPKFWYPATPLRGILFKKEAVSLIIFDEFPLDVRLKAIRNPPFVYYMYYITIINPFFHTPRVD